MKGTSTREITLLRITIIKEKSDFYIGKDSDGNKYKIFKKEGSKHFSVGDDKYIYLKKLRKSLLYKGILRLLSQKEEYELLDKNQLPSLQDLGMDLSNL